MRRLRRDVIIIALLALIASPACVSAQAVPAAAQPASSAPPAPWSADNAALLRQRARQATGELEGPIELGPLALRLASTTGIVLMATVVTLLALRRYVARRGGPITGTQSMSIEATLPLAHRSSLQVIRLDEHRLVVGCDAGGLRAVLLLPETFSQAMDGAAAGDQKEIHPNAAAWDDTNAFHATSYAAPHATPANAEVADPYSSRPSDWELTRWKPQRPIM